MRVQHRAGAALFHDAQMKQAFVGWFRCVIADEAGVLVNGENLFSGQFTFVDTARTHREAQRIALDDRTEVAARAEQPATRMKTPGNGGESGGEFKKVVWHVGKDA